MPAQAMASWTCLGSAGIWARAVAVATLVARVLPRAVSGDRRARSCEDAPPRGPLLAFVASPRPLVAQAAPAERGQGTEEQL